MADFTIRPAARADAAVIAGLANRLSRHEGYPEAFTEAKVRRDLFGDRPAASVLLAERDGVVVGYALYYDCYNTDIAARGLWLGDLYVVEAARGGGIGRALMAAMAAAAVDRGAESLWWGVRSANAGARAFYAGLGARDDDARILELDRAALARLAAEDR